MTVTSDGDKLIVRGPRRAGPVALRLLAHKRDLLPLVLPPEWHLLWDERAAIMEFDGKLPRERAEALSLDEVLTAMRKTEP